MKKFISVFSFVAISLWAIAQDNLPTDYLPASFHKGRRDELRKRMPANSVVAIFAFPERVFSNDVNYAYHPNPDLFYFSGYKEPDALLLVFKEEQKKADGTTYNEIFFVRQRDALREQWDGRRLGTEGVKQKLGFTEVYNSNAFRSFPLDLKGKRVIFDVLPADLGEGMLGPLVEAFREKAGIPTTGNTELLEAYRMIRDYTDPALLPRRINQLKSLMANAESAALKQDPYLQELLAKPDSATLVAVQRKLHEVPIYYEDFYDLVAGLREIKTTEELAILRKAAFYSSIAHEEVMKAITPGMSETELHGIFMYIHKKYGAEDEGYPPIVGAGGNGCILHYIENNATRVNNQLVLMDVGAEYHLYTADVTRTVPANGKFTPEQKAIYNLVYQAQEEVMKICKAGTPFRDLNRRATEVLAEGLLKLGIIKNRSEVNRYYPHGCSHHLGLDVHDKSVSPDLKENMVITVEPGIYIPEGSPCDKKWWNIAVRIEDDVIIGRNGCENISAAAPRKAEDVEKAAAKTSPLSNYSLPSFRSK
jgi:Xaa-Pro aminopeptidase